MIRLLFIILLFPSISFAQMADDTVINPVTGEIDKIGLKWTSVPATASETCTAGQYSSDADYFYICHSANTWKRVAILTWSVEQENIIFDGENVIFDGEQLKEPI